MPLARSRTRHSASRTSSDVTPLIDNLALEVAGASDTLETMTYRLAGQGSLRLVTRVSEPRRPLRSWFPIEVLSIQSGPRVAAAELEAGLAAGVIHRDTRPVEAFAALARREQLTFPRPTVVEDALLAADVAALGEADAFRLRSELDEVEIRLRAVEERASIRLERRLRGLLRRG